MNGSPGPDLHGVGGAGQRHRHASRSPSQPGTNPDLAQVDVQNRLSRATPRLPAAVTQQGVRVDKSRSNFLLFTILSSDNPAVRPDGARRLRVAQRRCPRSSACPASARRSCSAPSARCASGSTRPSWSGFNLSSADVNAAIRAQNAQVSSGTIGDLPNVAGPGDRRHGGRQRPARQRRAVRQHRAARQHRRLDRAAARRGAHRARRPGLRHLGAPERQAVHRHRRAALAHRQRAGHRQGGPRADGRAVALLPAGREVRHPVRQLALRQHLDHARWSRRCSRRWCWCSW